MSTAIRIGLFMQMDRDFPLGFAVQIRVNP
jgi:hypothetical protein